MAKSHTLHTHQHTFSLLVACTEIQLMCFFVVVVSMMFDKPSSTIECHSTLSSCSSPLQFIYSFFRSFVRLWLLLFSCIFRSLFCSLSGDTARNHVCTLVEKRGRNFKWWRVVLFVSSLFIHCPPRNR